MTVKPVKSVVGLASMGPLRLIGRVAWGPPQVPKNPRILFDSKSRPLPSHFTSGTLFFGATTSQEKTNVGKRRESLHAPNGEPPLFTCGEGGSLVHRRNFVFL